MCILGLPAAGLEQRAGQCQAPAAPQGKKCGSKLLSSFITAHFWAVLSASLCLCEPGAAVKHPSAKLGGFLGLKHRTQMSCVWLDAGLPVLFLGRRQV